MSSAASKTQYSNLMSKELIPQAQVLSSFVINTPYKFDEHTTSPRVAKVFSFPFGVRTDAISIFKGSFKFISSMSLFMIVSCILVLSLYLPLQAQNNLMLNNAKTLTSKQISLQANLQEESSYTKLFTSLDKLELMDSEETVHVNNIKNNTKIENRNLITFNKYPSLQFSGF